MSSNLSDLRTSGLADSRTFRLFDIAEGSTGQSNAEFKRFLGIALRSDIEVVGCIYLAKRRSIINEQDFSKIYESCEEILVMINALRNSLD